MKSKICLKITYSLHKINVYPKPKNGECGYHSREIEGAEMQIQEHIFTIGDFGSDQKGLLRGHEASILAERYRIDQYQDSGFYDWRLWKDVFKMLDEAPVQKIYFTHYRNPDIIYDIVHVNFYRLTSLILDHNLITSIEPLMAVKAPRLKKLNIQFNLITNIDCLKRCEFPQLEELELSDNFIISCVCIADCYFPRMKRLAIQAKYHSTIYMENVQGVGTRQLANTSSVNGYDLRWITKLETPTMEWIKYAADHRIIRKDLEEQLGLKFYKVRVEKKDMELGALMPFMAY